jgi:hypothetical protein
MEWKVIKIEVGVSTCIVGSRREEIIEVHVPENATDQEIEEIKSEAAKEWLYENIDFGWCDVK